MLRVSCVLLLLPACCHCCYLLLLLWLFLFLCFSVPVLCVSVDDDDCDYDECKMTRSAWKRPMLDEDFVTTTTPLLYCNSWRKIWCSNGGTTTAKQNFTFLSKLWLFFIFASFNMVCVCAVVYFFRSKYKRSPQITLCTSMTTLPECNWFLFFTPLLLSHTKNST